ncbi:hypothetical protein [Leptospira terpstrae]|uniref:Uncharacterized protein n=1 Tax=Leptospira terpstrae serovar Hualin str. LT 11-33 = ATCC 700639 TaxID=1257025 RepID=N1VRU9_9LEPT|nr:hypothetical protein [Leptospira terpstrae]EMY62449.1 hypothetical protein LEP1GSC203_0001 [Leptospira terpstrae serovar Hualin str. LT 11-33 = ATCC 700639]
MLLNKISTHPILSKHIVSHCEENQIQVEVDKNFPRDKYLILKVDSYYNSLHLALTPPSPDCLYIIYCEKGNYFSLYCYELKNIKDKQYLKIENIYGKFKTLIDDFLKTAFSSIFLDKNEDIRISTIAFVSDPYELAKMGVNNTTLTNTHTKGTLIETLLLKKPLNFRGTYISLEYKLPDPVISPC